LFRFTTTDLRALHVAVMVAFEQAAVLAPALNLDAVRAALAATGWDEPIDDAGLQQTLTSLTQWGLLEATQDHAARYATPEEFERRNLQWSLTPRGEAAITGVLHAVDTLAHAVGLQTAILDAIGDDLDDLARLAAEPRSPQTDARLSVELRQIEQHLSSLVVSVRQFNGHLQRLLRDDGTGGDDLFVEVKRRTVSYLEEYVEGVERPQRRLVHGIERVEQFGLAAVFDRALVGANLAPIAGEDPGADYLAAREHHWNALRAWFAPTTTDRPLVDGLLETARTAIIELLRVLERRWEGRRRSASVAADFRTLGHLFAATATDEDAHRLFAAAFGLWPARHAHLRAADGEARAPTTPWAATEAVEVAPSLRTSGTLTNVGRVRPVGDPARVRAARQRQQAEALAAHHELRQALATDGGVTLSAFGRLDSAAFAELLTLLAAALDAARDSDGIRRALSADGQVEIVLHPPRTNRLASLVTDAGVLRGPDFVVSIALTDASPGRAPEAAVNG
jgi:uncharacterized protein (TIGR02677 family)